MRVNSLKLLALLGMVALFSISVLAGQSQKALSSGPHPVGPAVHANSPDGAAIQNPAPLFAVNVNDGSFENVPSAWTEADTTGCLPWIGSWNGMFEVAQIDGPNQFWAGGWCGAPNSNYAEQVITLPAASPLTLNFWAIYDRLDPDDAVSGTFYINVNGTPVFTKALIAANNTWPSWVQEGVDLTSYAGQTVTLRIGAVNPGPGVGNVLVDALTLDVPSAFDLSFMDDYSRSQLCVDSATGAWQWSVLKGNGAGNVYTGAGTVMNGSGYMRVVAAAASGYGLNFIYYTTVHRATGSFTYRPDAVSSALYDANTLDDKVSCGAVDQPPPIN